jgi:hypothetical protein
MEPANGWLVLQSCCVQALLLHSSWVRRVNLRLRHLRLRQLVKVARYLFHNGKVASQSALRAMQELQRFMHVHSAAAATV